MGERKMKNQSKKLWDKGTTVDNLIEKFTVGEDRNLDVYLAECDVLGSLAHIGMLESIDLLTKDELEKLKTGLVQILKEVRNGSFVIDDGVEDVHSHVELILTQD